MPETEKEKNGPGAQSGPPIVVQKYGGSSVATTAKIMAVARRIEKSVESGKRVCVVVSAMANTTDELLEKAGEISQAPPRRELDMLLSCGERAAMALLSMAVSELGLEAISFTGSQCGILTNDRHWGARIVEVRPFRVLDELERGKVVIVAGFQGVSYKREITTLGRGGSDTTAVALAAALSAEYCEICSDVDGVFTADPRVVSAASLLDSIGHDAMTELATHGARVLHPQAIEFAKHSGIKLWARGTSSDARGTRIDRPDESSAGSIGVAGQKNLFHLSFASSETAQLLSVLSEAGVEVASLSQADSGGQIMIDRDDAPEWPAIVATFAGYARIREAGAVSVVGAGLGARAEALARALEVAAAEGISVIQMAASPLRLTLSCDRADVDALCSALHREFVEG